MSIKRRSEWVCDGCEKSASIDETFSFPENSIILCVEELHYSGYPGVKNCTFHFCSDVCATQWLSKELSRQRNNKL